MAWDNTLLLPLMGVLGLLVGSFLNVVIHRLPVMLEKRWAAECAQLHAQADEAEGHAHPVPPSAAPYNLVVPRSRCPHCEHAISWVENIPVLSYVWLKGRCKACQAPISRRYPLVELLTSALFVAVAWRWGASAHMLVLCGFAAALVALACIDWDTTLLPDDITLPLVWAGLLSAALGLGPVTLSSAFWGAVAGYLVLWSIYWVFKLLTGKEGMGYGDFKLLAAMGACLGWEALLPVILMASISGTVVGVVLKMRAELREGAYVPFGPFLAMGGLGVVLFPQVGQWL